MWNETRFSQAKDTVCVDHTKDYQWVEVQSKRSKKTVSTFANASASHQFSHHFREVILCLWVHGFHHFIKIEIQVKGCLHLQDWISVA